MADDWFLLPFELKLQRAHARALLAAGILSEGELADLRDGLARLEEQYTDCECPESDAEDLHTWVESELVELAGQAGRKIHTARSRNDQVATLLKLYAIDAGARLSRATGKLVRTCCIRAKDWAHMVFPVQTHCQFAAPGTVGFWVLRYAAAFERLGDQLESCLTQWRRYCPLGSGAVAGSSIPIDRTIQAAELGFDGPSLNALDSTGTRDECLQLLSSATQAALHLQSFATDVIAFSQTPFGWTVYPAGFGTGSSMMPNKANPDAMELLRGQCCDIMAAHAQAVLLLKGLPSGYNRDLQCIKPLLHRAIDNILGLCSMADAFLQELDFDTARLADSLKLGDISATLRMEEQVLQGTPLRDAHRAVAVTPASGDSCDSALHSVDAYQTAGSASPAETLRIADELLQRVRV